MDVDRWTVQAVGGAKLNVPKGTQQGKHGEVELREQRCRWCGERRVVTAQQAVEGEYSGRH